MGHKGVRAMTPLDQALANELRVKLGKGRELPEQTAKPKRVAKPRAPKDDTAGAPTKPSRAKKGAAVEEPAADEAVEVRPAATIVKPKPVVTTEIVPEPPVIAKPAAEIAPEPPKIAPPPPVEQLKPAAVGAPAAPALPAAPSVRRAEPKIVPFRPLERPPVQ